MRTYTIKKYFPKPPGREVIHKGIATLDEAKIMLEKEAKKLKATEDNPVSFAEDGMSFTFTEITGSKKNPVKLETRYEIL